MVDKAIYVVILSLEWRDNDMPKRCHLIKEIHEKLQKKIEVGGD